MSSFGDWGERPGDRDALPLAAGQFGRAVPGVVGQADNVEQQAHPFVPQLRCRVGDAQRHADVLGRGQDRDEAERLEHETTWYRERTWCARART